MELFFGKTKISEGLAGTGAIWEITLYPQGYEMYQRERNQRKEERRQKGWKGEIKLSLQNLFLSENSFLNAYFSWELHPSLQDCVLL